MDGRLTIADVREAVLPILRRRGAAKAALFGSCARGDMGPDSDVDILVEIPADLSLLDFVQLKQEVAEALGRKVDLVEYDALKPSLRDGIIRQQVSIL
jgi:uncharacterized protein